MPKTPKFNDAHLIQSCEPFGDPGASYAIELSGADLDAFARDGVVCVRGAVPLDLLPELERAIDAHLGRWSPGRRGVVFGDSRFFTLPNVWKTDAFFHRLAQHEVLLRIAAQLMRSPRLSLLQSQIFVKLPGCAKEVDWHQDQGYAPITGSKMVSIWMATSPVTRQSGGLQFVRGSQHGRWALARPRLLPIDRLFPFLERGRSTPPPPQVDEAQVVEFDLEPGDVLAFHGATLHRSGRNTSANLARKGYSVRYVGDDVHYHPGRENGVTYNFWDAKLRPGAVMSGPLFPVLFEAGRPVPRVFEGPRPMQVHRIVLSQLAWMRDLLRDRRAYGNREKCTDKCLL